MVNYSTARHILQLLAHLMSGIQESVHSWSLQINAHLSSSWSHSKSPRFISRISWPSSKSASSGEWRRQNVCLKIRRKEAGIKEEEGMENGGSRVGSERLEWNTTAFLPQIHTLKFIHVWWADWLVSESGGCWALLPFVHLKLLAFEIFASLNVTRI